MKTFLTLLTLSLTLLAQTLTAANRYWIAASPGSWTSTGNWSASPGGAGGASVPGSSDVAIFDNNGLGNASIPGTLTLSGLTINSGYTGNITQGAAAITITGNATFAGGTFTGSGSSLTVNGTLTLSGSTFIAPAQLTLNGGSYTLSGGSINTTSNNSNFTFASGTTITGSQTLNNVTFTNTTPWPMTYTLAAGATLTITGNINTTGTQSQTWSGGTINIQGNLSLANTATGGGGTTVFNFNGTGSQSITSSLAISQGALPAIVINKSSGTLTLPALISIGGSTWTYTTGTIDATTNNSTVAFTGNTTITGTHTLNNITFANTTPWPMTYTLSSGTTLTANGTVTMSGTAAQTYTGGTISLMGDLSLTNTATGSGGTTVLSFAGTGNQSILSSLPLGQGALPSVTINKSSGTLTLPALITMAGTKWTYSNGAIDATTNNNTVVFNSNTTITGSHTLNSVNFSNTTPWGITYTLSAGTTLTTGGTLTLSGSSSINLSGGTISVTGNTALTNTSTGDGGTTVLAFTGTGSQAITSSLPINQGALPSVNINKPSGTLTFPAILTMAGSNWTYTQGTLDVTTNNSNVVFDGNTTITGSHSLNNVTFNNTTPWGITYTIAAGTTLTTTGTLYLSGGSSITLSTGTINVQGDMNLTNTSTGDGGTTVLAFVGAGNQSIISSLPVNQSSLPSVNINKPSGTLTFPAILTMAGSNWTYTAGTLDATTNNSNIVFDGNTTITGSHTLDNVTFNNITPWPITYTIAAGTTLTTSGTLYYSGASGITLSNGTIDLLGDLNLANTSTADGGTTVLTFAGTGNQSIVSSLPVYQSALPSVNINKTSGTLTFPAILTMAGAKWTYTQGTLDVTTNNSTVYFTNNVTLTGSHTLNNVNFTNATPWPITYTFTAGTTLTNAGTTTIGGSAGITFSAGTIALQGDLNLTNTSTADGGTTVLAFVGTGNQAITSSLPYKQNSLPSISINKASGTLTFPAILTIAGSTWTYTAGNVDATTNMSTVYFTSTATINSAGMNFYNINFTGGSSAIGNALSVNNNFTITSPAVLSAVANTISLMGNWSDWGPAGFTEGTASTVNFIGSSLQTISSPGGEAFANLTINNSGPGITLANNVGLLKTLTMTKGNIDLNTNTLTIGTGTANPGALAYTAGMIINTGSVTRWFKTGAIATGSSTGLYPFGTTAGDYRPFSVSAPTTGPTSGGTITVAYTDGVTNTAVSFPDGAATVQVRKNLNWAVTTGNGLNGGNYNLGIAGTNYGQIGNVSDLRLTLVNSVVGTAGVNAGTTLNPQVNRTALTTANLNNTFYLGSINPGMSSLPVTLIDFSAREAGSTVLLDWTATLIGENTGFTILRSADGNTWTPLQVIPGQGAGTTADYTTVDPTPLDGTSYYRLSIAGQDGSLFYSSIAVVNLSVNSSATLSVYPNPVATLLTVNNTRPGACTISLFSQLGQQVIQLRSENESPVQLNVSGLAAGFYFLRISGVNWMETKKIVIKR
ncbi:MAG TPA: T9SS type A sorting domain-containing protein [Puia sp.]|uniref:T9SS type A sorting domain-containing protein n=1 Tax=Puia sp. TaxID=2045100 RepID=UPI002CA095DA|nr:T9SS type A sorting domain-containing protein [Puia sp.]HVU95374.1 T9SS type A sorting domain-containing protein [Puia sp.]